MTPLILYGLDGNGQVIVSERLASGADLDEVVRRQLARAQKVEVWDGPVCIFRRTAAQLSALGSSSSAFTPPIAASDSVSDPP